MKSIGIVGSGHTAIAVARKLVERGVRPTILDVGDTLDPALQQVIERLRTMPRTEWAAEDIAEVTRNATVTTDKPRRLAYGSHYVYGGNRDAAPFDESEEGPRPTFARGGFSEVWGAAMLPADDCDIANWPIRHADLAPYYQQVLDGLPLSAVDDGLARHFPLFRSNPEALKLPPAIGSFLNRLNRSRSLNNRDDVSFGQARLAVRVSDSEQAPGCSYCGYCLSGCVYGSIYTATEDLTRLERAGDVDYRPGHTVIRIDQRGDQVVVTSRRADGSQDATTFDRVFLAAGAINSTRIVLESKRLFDERVVMKTTQGFVLPMLRLRSAPFVWPDANTLAGVFFEFKTPGVSEHWAHVQINSANELVMQRLGYQVDRRGMKQRLLKMGLKRLLVAACNFHSDHAGSHTLTLRAGANGQPGSLAIETMPSDTFAFVARRAARRLTRHMLRVGVMPLLPMIRGAYKKPWGWHFGGTMPMAKNPKGELATDVLGRPTGWSRVHVVDSSVFPSIPATTLALVAMANACRIADQSPLD